MSTMLKKTLAGAVAALSLGAMIASTSTTTAEARGGWHGGHGGWHGGHGGWHGGGWHGGHWRGGWGWGGAGLLGGLALGAALAGPYGYGYGYGYPGYGYGGGCYYVQRPVYDYYGNFRGYRPVERCY